MARKPFLSLLVVVAFSLALVAALLVVALPHPVRSSIERCARDGGFCLGLLMAGRTIGTPLLLAQFPWSLWSGMGNGWRQWWATRRGLARLHAYGLGSPAGLLRMRCAELGLSGKVRVIATDEPLALCCGVWRPRIWISTGTLALLPPAELTAVLLHERAHLRRLHPLQLLLARSFAAALPFLPVVRELADALPRAQELAADRVVIGAGQRRALGRALLALVESRSAAPALPLSAGMVDALDARIDQLTGTAIAPTRLSRRALVQTWLILGLGLLLLTVATAGLVTGPVPLASMALAPWQAALPWRSLALYTILCGALRSLWPVVRSSVVGRPHLRRRLTARRAGQR